MDFHQSFTFTSDIREFNDIDISITLALEFIFITMCKKNGLCPKMIEKLWFG